MQPSLLTDVPQPASNEQEYGGIRFPHRSHTKRKEPPLANDTYGGATETMPSAPGGPVSSPLSTSKFSAFIAKIKAASKEPSEKKPRTTAQKPQKSEKKKTNEASESKADQPWEVGVFTPTYFDLPTTAAEAKTIQDYAEEYGFVVFQNVATPEEAQTYEGKFWDWLEAASPRVSRQDSTTWTNFNWVELFAVALFKHYGIGTSPAQRYLRTLPNITSIFQVMYNRKGPFAVGLDGVRLIRGAEHKLKKHNRWLHTDMNRRLRKKPCWQGAMQWTDSSHPRTTGGFVCVPKAHKEVEALPLDSKYYATSQNYLPFPKDHPYYTDGVAKYLALPARSFLVWKSTLPHCNQPYAHSEKKEAIRHKVAAFVSMISFQPIEDLSQTESGVFHFSVREDGAIKRKSGRLRWEEERKANMLRGDTCTHWAIEVVNAKKPRSHAQRIKKDPSPPTLPDMCHVKWEDMSLAEQCLLLGREPEGFSISVPSWLNTTA